MRAAIWAFIAVLAFLAAAALGVAAFTRFSDEPEPSTTDPRHDAYERARYAEARLSVLLGIAACFAFLGGAAAAQKAWHGRRARTSP